MPLFERVKAQAKQVADQAAQRAQEAAQAGQAKIDELQARRQLDGLLRRFGQLSYLERAGRGTPEGSTELGQLFEQIRGHEAEHGALSNDPGA